MKYFVNILYNINIDFQNMQLIVLYEIIIYHHCLFVLHTQYDNLAQFCP